jgi:hypothetical protein
VAVDGQFDGKQRGLIAPRPTAQDYADLLAALP